MIKHYPPRCFREILRDEGYYNKWHAQIMSDILLPLIQDQNPPEENGTLLYYKYGDSMDDTPVPDHILGLYLVREVFRNLGLTSTDKIFEKEAGLSGTEQRFQDALNERFGSLAMTTKEHVQPPLLSQLLYLVHHIKRDEISFCEDEEEDIRFGKPANEMARENCPRARRLRANSLTPKACDFSNSFNWMRNIRDWEVNVHSFRDSENFEPGVWGH